MFDLKDLYRQVIVDHNKSPRNFRDMSDATAHAEGHNPLCGDRLEIWLKLDASGATIEDVSFKGTGCAISVASASLMTEALRGRSVAEFEALFGKFHGMVTSDPTLAVDETGLGKLAVLAGVREFPSRVKCASLCWHTMQRAVAGDGTVAHTE